MPQHLVLGAFEELTPNFVANAWHHPRSRPGEFARLPFWQELARGLEDGGFDFLFLAEAIGYPMTDEGEVPEAVIREAVQFPVHDPVALMSGLAATVSRLGLVVTASTTAQHPYLNARTLTTLDHLSDGRIGWNIVTSDNQHALIRLLGLDQLTPHDERYARADEFVDLSLRLWEGGWDDHALRVDKAAKVFADPAHVHRIRHEGAYFRYDGFYPATPSPQRTPTLFQAGTSAAGTSFAARYAECVFTQERDVDRLTRAVAGLREKTAAAGRPSDALSIVNGVSFVIGRTEAEAEERRADLDRTPTRDAAAALFLGWSGIDLSALDPDATLDDVSTEVGQTLVSQWRNDDGTSPTVGAVLDALPATMGGKKFTGTPDRVVDDLERFVAQTGIDGLLIENPFGGIDGYRDVIDEIIPRLRERGMLPSEPRSGTLREMVTRTGAPRLPRSHPGALHRSGTGAA